MVKITEELVRKRSEHNEREITTLEELSLHQEAIEKIEHLQNWCKELQILLLQGNIISRIENLHKLKKLEYLNLALNNIEVIENLNKCESLKKLDLTLNFIGNLESVCNLKDNEHLKELYLTGNPCTDYKGYRNYVIAKLPQLQCLDNTDITRTERLKALQIIDSIEDQIKFDQKAYQLSREEQRARLNHVNNDEISDEVFWKQESENCPEVRVEMAKRHRKARANDENEKTETVKPVTLFAKDGRPLNINQPKIKFVLNDDDPNEIILDLKIYKYLDTNWIKIDVQPTYVTVDIKGKILQLVLPDEICTSKSTSQRSQTTGHLMIRMPRIKARPVVDKKVQASEKFVIDVTPEERKERREYLEIGPDKLTELCNLTNNLVDESEVPPLD